jgi:hypothetical protein
MDSTMLYVLLRMLVYLTPDHYNILLQTPDEPTSAHSLWAGFVYNALGKHDVADVEFTPYFNLFSTWDAFSRIVTWIGMQWGGTGTRTGIEERQGRSLSAWQQYPEDGGGSNTYCQVLCRHETKGK